MKRLLFLLSVVAFSLLACGKEEVPPIDNPDPKELDLGSLTTASASGVILDESGSAVAGALVTLGNKSALSDENGVFFVENAQVRENLAQVRVEKTGYFLGSRSFRPKYNPNPFVRIKLLQRIIAGTISAEDGGKVEVSGKVTFDFQAGAMKDESGAPYSGSVQVAVQYLDPTASDLAQRMPGALLGFSEEDGESSLATYGMVAVELIGAQGQKLQLADGKPAKMTVNIPASLLSNAPVTIPLWYFDESLGIWMEEGDAVLENGAYVGQVSHFSFWNCDVSFPLVHLTGSLFYQTQDNPLSNVMVKLSIVGSANVGYGYTDENGVFEGDIPKDEALLLEVIDLCGEVVYQANIGPFALDVVLSPIVLASGSFTYEPVAVSGTLTDCDGLPVTDGYVKVEIGNDLVIWPADNSGAFGGQLQVCSEADLEVTGVDMANLVQSDVYSFPYAPEIVTGPIEACDNELAEYVDFTMDGDNFVLTEYIFMGDSIPGVSFGIYGSGPNQTNWLSMVVGGSSTGTFPANQFVFWYGPGLAVDAQDPENISVTVTQYSVIIGEVIKGTFEGTFLDDEGVSHTLDGSFKVIRDF